MAIKYDAISTLCSLYGETGRAHLALELAKEHLIPMRFCREFVLSGGIGDGNTEFYIQDEIDKLTDDLGTAIQSLALCEDLPNDPSTWEGKIELLRLSNKLYEMIYGDDLMFYHVRMSQNHWLISTYEMSQGKREDALLSLEAMAHHAVMYDRSKREDHGKHYSSPLTDKLIYPYPSEDFHELSEHNESYYKLDRMQSPRYDGIRDSERFRAVIEKLEASAE